MFKSTYNMMTVNTSSPIHLDSTGSTLTFAGPTINAEHAENGVIYYTAFGFSTPTAGFTPKLYHSYDAYQWFLNTTFPSISTVDSYSTGIDNLGEYLKLAYTMESSAGGSVRVFVNLNEDYSGTKI